MLHAQVADLHKVQNTSTSTCSEHHSPQAPSSILRPASLTSPVLLSLSLSALCWRPNAASSVDLTLPPATLLSCRRRRGGSDVGECLLAYLFFGGRDTADSRPSSASRSDLRGISPNCVRLSLTGFALLVLCSLFYFLDAEACEGKRGASLTIAQLAHCPADPKS